MSIVIGLTENLFAQKLDTSYPHRVTMTPNAAELARYVDSPISHYTGTPDITIPLYEIDVDDLKIPITLGYHASGIRVDQEATWVGLGWSLEVGSRISRTVNGTDDFMNGGMADMSYPQVSKGYFRSPEIGTTVLNQYELYGHPDCVAWASYEYELVCDPEPDIFYYNLPNISGKFILDKSRGAVLFDKSHNLKIEVIGISSNVSFKITDKDGNQFVYNQSETTQHFAMPTWLNKNLHTSSTVYDDYNQIYTGWLHLRFPDCEQDYEQFVQNPEPVKTSWCLTKIVTKHGKEIDFFYAPEVQRLPTQESCERYHFNGQSSLYYSKSRVVNNALRLTSIQGDFGWIDFIGSDRFDMKPSSNNSSKKLESLSIYNSTNNLVKSFKFDYGYFNDDYSGNYQYEHVFKRLKLNNVREYTLNSSYQLVPLNSGYTFDYYGGNFPPKNSKNVDYWGFQNGKTYGSNYYVGLRINTNMTFEGVKKDFNFDKAIIGTLKKITYPTGGTAEYEYESHTISSGYFEGNTYEWEPPNTNNLLSVDVFNYYVSVDHELYADYPSQRVETFVIEEPTSVKINCELENTMQTIDNTYTYDNLSNPLGRLRRISPSPSTLTTYACPFLWDYTPSAPQGQGSEAVLPEREISLSPGTYQFEAYRPPRDVLASWRLHFDRPLPTPETPSNGTNGPYEAGGIRIKEIRTEAKVRKFNYYTGTMMRQPVLYYHGWRVGIPDHISSCIVQTSESQTPLSSFNKGNFVGYDWVEEFVEDEAGNVIKTKYSYHNDAETEMFDDSFQDSPYYLIYTNGLLKSIERYKTESQNDPVLVEKEDFFYTSTQSNVIRAFKDKGQRMHDSDLLHFYYKVEWPLQTQHIKTTKTESGASIIEETNYTYNSKDLVSSTSYNIDDFEVVEKVKYPFDFNDAISQSMVTKNMIGTPVESITLKDGNVVEGTKTQYENMSGIYLPRTLFKTDIATSNISETQYSSYYQPYLYFNEYDSRGNLLDFNQSNGYHTFYVWGYNQSYPIAKIENFNSQVELTPAIEDLINNARTASENDVDHCTGTANCQEKYLRVALNELRSAFPNAIVTTYTYDPLIGITSITDANRKTTYYEYDSAGRLEAIRDDDNSIVKTYQYRYKPHSGN